MPPPPVPPDESDPTFPPFRVRCLAPRRGGGDATHRFDTREAAMGFAEERWEQGGLHGVIVAERRIVNGQPVWATIWFAPFN